MLCETESILADEYSMVGGTKPVGVAWGVFRGGGPETIEGL